MANTLAHRLHLRDAATERLCHVRHVARGQPVDVLPRLPAQVGDCRLGLRRGGVRERRPDVALVDIRMPPTHTDEGLRAAREIRSQYPETAVLVLSQYLEPDYALRLLEEPRP